MSSARPETVARVAGLRSRLLRRGDLAHLADAPDLASLTRALPPTVLPEALPAGLGPERVDAALARRTATIWGVFGRWFGAGQGESLLFGELDVEGLRVLFRAAAAGRSGRPFLPFLVPTRTLPAAVLAELAELPTPRDLARTLQRRRHPLAAAIRPFAEAARPDLSDLEGAMVRAWLRGAGDEARGDRELRAAVDERVDLANLRTLRTLADRALEGREKTLFIEGTERLTVARLASLLPRLGGTATRAEALDRLSRLLAGTPLRESVERWEEPGAGWENSVLEARLRRARRAAARAPGGWASLAAFALRIRAEATDLRTLLWGVALGRPADRIRAALVSPP